MQRYISFIKDENNPTDDELLLQLAFGMGRHLSNPKEEQSGFTTGESIPNSHVRRLMKLIVERCNLPVQASRVDEWINWHQGKDDIQRLTEFSKTGE
jgi:hypothetical protein